MSVAFDPGAVTVLLLAWGRGDAQAPERLLPLVEAELRHLARRRMARERRGHTLQPTALINEATCASRTAPPSAYGTAPISSPLPRASCGTCSSITPGPGAM
jgi:hypothetical protein